MDLSFLTSNGILFAILIAFVFGLFVGAIFKHAFKFLAILGVAIVIMFALGFISTQFFTNLLGIAQPEVSAFMKDPLLFAPAEAVVFILGMVVAIKAL